MRISGYVALIALGLCLLAGEGRAASVRVFKAGEANVSPMQLREQAMAEGFAQAVLDEARRMLPAQLDEARAEQFRLYMVERSKPYVQSYNILSSESMDAGLILTLDVLVDKTALRDELRRMGLFATTLSPQPAAMTLPQNLDEEQSAVLAGLMGLTGVRQAAVSAPVLLLEKGDGGVYTAHLDAGADRWTARGKDLSVVWFDVWGRFFTRAAASASRSDLRELSVAGWFSPDAALEFDRVLRGWDSAVQDVQLVELDMQPAGVGASWSLRLVNAERFDTLVNGYLPQRGLSHQLTQEAR
jgi:hypothetical protein